MMAEHTPTPWRLDTRWSRLIVQGPNNEDIASVFGTRSDEGKACAAFIVRAVNCHEELVAALEVAEHCVWALEETQRAVGHDHICTKELDQVRTALAHAKDTP